MLSSFEHSGVPEDSKSSLFSKCWASPPHLAKVGLRQQLYYQKEQDMVMQFNVGHTSVRERKKSKGTMSKEEEEDQDVMCEIIINEFVE